VHESPRVGGFPWWLGPSLWFLASLALLRIQVMEDLGLRMGDAVGYALPAGLFYDLVAVLLVGAAGLAASAVSRALGAAIWICAAWLIWIPSLANLLYFRFFGGMLEWWVVRFHLSDVGPVSSGAFALALQPAILGSIACALVATALVVRAGSATRDARRRRASQVLAQSLALAFLALVAREVPGWSGLYGVSRAHPMLREQVLQVWLRDAFSARSIGAEWSWRDQVWSARRGKGELSTEQRDWARKQVAAYRELRDPLVRGSDPGLTGTDGAAGSLDDATRGATFEPEGALPAGDVRALRRRLALPEEGRLNVLVVFVESMRALEFLHPELRDRVFPGTRKFVSEHGIVFRQTYASALEAGQSVRARFTTLCSMLPNLEGAATYLAYPLIEVPCLAEVFRDAGYRTIWLTSALGSYHNASIFERAHGTDVFYDEVHFRQQGIEARVGGWGLADLPVLEEVVRVLERESREGAFFAALTTISSHFPMSIVPEGPLPESLAAETAGFPEYQAYLSRMIYEDRSLTRFFELFAESELADDTLIVLLGDHSIRIDPHLPLTPIQQVETQFRVPLALVSARLRQPGEVLQPVHQLDIAPTLAFLGGVAVAEEWMGRGLLAEPAAPWVFLRGSTIHYRTEARACYTLTGEVGVKCYATSSSDPLFERSLPEVPEDPELTRFFAGLGPAMELLISHDLLAADR
jgi:hypothetical protein